MRISRPGNSISPQLTPLLAFELLVQLSGFRQLLDRRARGDPQAPGRWTRFWRGYRATKNAQRSVTEEKVISLQWVIHIS
jgi:hypothetical protein